MPYPLLSTRDEGAHKKGHAMVGTENVMLLSTCRYQAPATRDEIRSYAQSSATAAK